MKEIAWLAGFFEGEGSIILSKPTLRGDGRYSTGRVLITISNTDLALLGPFSSRYGGKVILHERSRGRGFTHRWSCPGPSELGFLQDILPHLVGRKREKVGIALEYLKLMRTPQRSGRTPLTDNEKELRQQVYNRFYPEGPRSSNKKKLK